MPQRSRLVCQCGGEVPRPMPPNCPHCGRIIAAVRRPALAYLWPVVVISSLFGLLIVGMALLLRFFA